MFRVDDDEVVEGCAKSTLMKKRYRPYREVFKLEVLEHVLGPLGLLNDVPVVKIPPLSKRPSSATRPG